MGTCCNAKRASACVLGRRACPEHSPRHCFHFFFFFFSTSSETRGSPSIIQLGETTSCRLPQEHVAIDLLREVLYVMIRTKSESGGENHGREYAPFSVPAPWASGVRDPRNSLRSRDLQASRSGRVGSAVRVDHFSREWNALRIRVVVGPGGSPLRTHPRRWKPLRRPLESSPFSVGGPPHRGDPAWPMRCRKCLDHLCLPRMLGDHFAPW